MSKKFSSGTRGDEGGAVLPRASKPTLEQRLRAAGVGQYVKLQKVEPHGALQARLLQSGAIRFYWRYTCDGQTQRQPLGLFDATLPPKQFAPSKSGGLTVAGAAARAVELARVHDEWRDRGGYRAYEAQLQAAAQKASTAAADVSLRALLEHYWQWLEARGRKSHRQVRWALTRHVIDAHPELAARAANELTTEDFQRVLAQMKSAGIGREMNKVLANLKAAYNRALSTEAGTEDLSAFALTANPLALIRADKAFDRADKDPLPKSQMRLYWRCIADLPGLPGAALRTHLLLGAPRALQLGRLLVADIDESWLKLVDAKGRQGSSGPRDHILPTATLLAEDLELLRSQKGYAISSDGGRMSVCAGTLNKWAKRAVGDRIPGFKLKRLRSGVETLLAEYDVPQQVRARLQSHGLGGVQARHYDAFEYLPQKRRALQILRDAIVRGAEPADFHPQPYRRLGPRIDTLDPSHRTPRMLSRWRVAQAAVGSRSGTQGAAVARPTDSMATVPGTQARGLGWETPW